MCGIVGAVSTRNIVPILVQGLQRLEYRGYDSCGVAVHAGGLKRARSTARVAELTHQVAAEHVEGMTGIAHTRWATHGAPAVHNAHPHFSHGPGADAASRPGRVALVHNGIIENFEELRVSLQAKGYVFASQTDTEVIAHLVDSLYDGDLFEAVKVAVAQLRGAYAIAVFHKDEPHRVVGARVGSPLILGVGRADDENFLASDAMALAGVTDQIVYLEEGDVVDLQLGKYWIVDRQHKPVQQAREDRPGDQRRGGTGALPALHAEGNFRAATSHRRHAGRRARASCPSFSATARQPRAGRHRQRAHPGLRHQLLQRLHGQVLARRHRGHADAGGSGQRIPLPLPACPTRKRWWSIISQSGETADTLAALRHAQSPGHAAHPDHLQRADQRHGARVQAGV